MLKSVAITYSHTRLSFLYLEFCLLDVVGSIKPKFLGGRRSHAAASMILINSGLFSSSSKTWNFNLFYLIFQVMPLLDAWATKGYGIWRNPPRCVNTSKEIFSKRIYHSRNSVTHTESNQQHSIFLYCWSTNAICCYHCAKKVLNCWCN